MGIKISLMIPLALIAALFFGLAKKEKMNVWLWPLLAIASYFVGQLIAGFILGLVAPNLLESRESLVVISLVSGALACGVLYLIMHQQIKKKREQDNRSELLDDNL